MTPQRLHIQSYFASDHAAITEVSVDYDAFPERPAISDIVDLGPFAVKVMEDCPTVRGYVCLVVTSSLPIDATLYRAHRWWQRIRWAIRETVSIWRQA